MLTHNQPATKQALKAELSKNSIYRVLWNNTNAMSKTIQGNIPHILTIYFDLLWK